MIIRFPSLRCQAFQYPAGERQVRILPSLMFDVQRETEEIQFDAKIRSSNDIMDLLLLADAVGNEMRHPYVKCILNLPYLPYSRADRRFTPGDCHGLNTFMRVLTSGMFDEIRTLDAHNPSFIEHRRLYDPAIRNIEPTGLILDTVQSIGGKVTVLLPDKGAYDRYSTTLVRSGLEVRYCSKNRDAATGALTGFDVPDIAELGSRVLVVDDICDGGGTFVGIAEKLRQAGVHRMYLYVTHGIFSQGEARLLQYFEKIYTTDSIRAYGGMPGQMETFSAFEYIRLHASGENSHATSAG